MACSPEQCDALEALKAVLDAESLVIQAEIELANQELQEVNSLRESVQTMIDECECQTTLPPEGESRISSLSAEQKARVRMIIRVSQIMRKQQRK